MNLYFFIKNVVWRYVNYGLFDKSSKYPELSEYKNDLNVVRFNYLEYRIKNDRHLAIELSRLILLEINRKFRFDNMRYLYCELMFITKEINRLVRNKEKLTHQNMRYLFIIYYHYVNGNSLISLVNDLMKDQVFFIRYIKRIFDYPCFRDWITIRHQLKEYRSYSIQNAYCNNWDKTDLFKCFECELLRISKTKSN